MTVLNVDIEEINSYEKSISEKAKKYDEVVKSMGVIYENLQNCWSGYAADVFKANAEAYLNNLGAIRDSLLSAAETVSAYKKMYKAKIEDFYS